MRNSEDTFRGPDLSFVVTVPAIKYFAAARRPYLAFPPVVHAPGVPGPGVFDYSDKKMIAEKERSLSHGHEKMVVTRIALVRRQRPLLAPFPFVVVLCMHLN